MLLSKWTPRKKSKSLAERKVPATGKHHGNDASQGRLALPGFAQQPQRVISQVRDDRLDDFKHKGLHRIDRDVIPRAQSCQAAIVGETVQGPLRLSTSQMMSKKCLTEVEAGLSSFNGNDTGVTPLTGTGPTGTWLGKSRRMRWSVASIAMARVMSSPCIIVMRQVDEEKDTEILV